MWYKWRVWDWRYHKLGGRLLLLNAPGSHRLLSNGIGGLSVAVTTGWWLTEAYVLRVTPTTSTSNAQLRESFDWVQFTCNRCYRQPIINPRRSVFDAKDERGRYASVSSRPKNQMRRTWLCEPAYSADEFSAFYFHKSQPEILWDAVAEADAAAVAVLWLVRARPSTSSRLIYHHCSLRSATGSPTTRKVQRRHVLVAFLSVTCSQRHT